MFRRPTVRRGYVLAVVAGLAVGCGSYAGAAVVQPGSKALGSGGAAVSSCETSTLTFPRRSIDNAAAHNVTSLLVATIDPACSGATLTVTLLNASGAGLQTGSTTVSSTTARVTFSGSAPAASVTGYAVALAGA
jgi:hypothetical protein